MRAELTRRSHQHFVPSYQMDNGLTHLSEGSKTHILAVCHHCGVIGPVPLCSEDKEVGASNGSREDAVVSVEAVALVVQHLVEPETVLEIISP